MEVAKLCRGISRAAQDGIAERLLFVSAQGAELRGRLVEPGGMGGPVALLGSHLMDAASHELSQPHEWMRGEREGKGIGGGNRGEGAPVFEHEAASFPLESAVGSRHGGVFRKRREVRQEERVDHWGKGEAFEEGEGEMGQGVNWEVGPHWGGGTGRSPVKRHDVRGQAGTKRPIPSTVALCRPPNNQMTTTQPTLDE